MARASALLDIEARIAAKSVHETLMGKIVLKSVLVRMEPLVRLTLAVVTVLKVTHNTH